jgi:hypothetical protein
VREWVEVKGWEKEEPFLQGRDGYEEGVVQEEGKVKGEAFPLLDEP